MYYRARSSSMSHIFAFALKRCRSGTIIGCWNAAEIAKYHANYKPSRVKRRKF